MKHIQTLSLHAVKTRGLSEPRTRKARRCNCSQMCARFAYPNEIIVLFCIGLCEYWIFFHIFLNSRLASQALRDIARMTFGWSGKKNKITSPPRLVPPARGSPICLFSSVDDSDQSGQTEYLEGSIALLAIFLLPTENLLRTLRKPRDDKHVNGSNRER